MRCTRFRRVVLGASVLALGAGVLAVAAPAAAAPAPDYRVYADVTGDGIADRVAFVDLSTATRSRCYAWVRVGQRGGGLGSPQHVHLPLPAGVTHDACPAGGQVLAAPRPGGRRLAAVVTGGLQDMRELRVYDLTGGAVAAGVASLDSDIRGAVGDQFGSVDFDGDGYGDWWVAGGTGATLYLNHHTSWSTLYADTGRIVASTVQFFDLNRAGGKDVIVESDAEPNGVDPAIVNVVDGRTGAVQRLATGDDDGTNNGISAFRVGVVDLDHNAYPDIAVYPTHVDGTTAPTERFLNRSQGGRWYFQPFSF